MLNDQISAYFKAAGKLLVIVLLSLLCTVASSKAQEVSMIDSLQRIINTTTNDSIRGVQSINLAYLYEDMNAHSEAIALYLEGIELLKGVGMHKEAGGAHSMVSGTYRYLGDLEKALEHLNYAYDIAVAVHDTAGIAEAYKDLGYLFYGQEEYAAAREKFEAGLALLKAIKDTGEIAKAYNNIAVVYTEEDNYEKALELYYQSLFLRNKIKKWKSVAASYTNIGKAFIEMGDTAQALDYYYKAINLQREIGDSTFRVNSHLKLGHLFFEVGDLRSAKAYADSCLFFAQHSGRIKHLQRAAFFNYRVYRALGQDSKALAFYEDYIERTAEMESEQNKKASIKSQFQYAYREQSLADSLAFVQQQELEALAHDAELREEAEQRYMLYGGLVFLLVLGGVAFRGYQRKRKDNQIITAQKELVEAQKVEVEEQKAMIEEKNKEIVDSINYARRIQTAILPPARLVKEHLPNSFVLYKPKDIVAGDFYWMAPVENQVLFAAADCTGHGVPGAMVSVVCNSGLNRSVREFGLTDPGRILDKTRELVIQEFEKSEEEVKDGMDIALVGLEYLESATTGSACAKVKYAGAHNPIWIVRKDAEAVEEIKADKQPIGKFESPSPYTTHEVELYPDDAFYVFSDGFADQFGGEKGKKFKSANFKRLLLSIQHEPMETQLELLDNAFENWRGALEQLDDVCVIGVRI